MANVAPGAPAALTPKQAADTLSMSLSSFRRYVLPNVKVIRFGNTGRGVRVPVGELDAYVAKSAKRS